MSSKNYSKPSTNNVLSTSSSEPTNDWELVKNKEQVKIIREPFVFNDNYVRLCNHFVQGTCRFRNKLYCNSGIHLSETERNTREDVKPCNAFIRTPYNHTFEECITNNIKNGIMNLCNNCMFGNCENENKCLFRHCPDMRLNNNKQQNRKNLADQYIICSDWNNKIFCDSKNCTINQHKNQCPDEYRLSKIGKTCSPDCIKGTHQGLNPNLNLNLNTNLNTNLNLNKKEEVIQSTSSNNMVTSSNDNMVTSSNDNMVTSNNDNIITYKMKSKINKQLIKEKMERKKENEKKKEENKKKEEEESLIERDKYGEEFICLNRNLILNDNIINNKSNDNIINNKSNDNIIIDKTNDKIIDMSDDKIIDMSDDIIIDTNENIIIDIIDDIIDETTLSQREFLSLNTNTTYSDETTLSLNTNTTNYNINSFSSLESILNSPNANFRTMSYKNIYTKSDDTINSRKSPYDENINSRKSPFRKSPYNEMIKSRKSPIQERLKLKAKYNKEKRNIERKKIKELRGNNDSDSESDSGSESESSSDSGSDFEF
jgi:hypothetical protein